MMSCKSREAGKTENRRWTKEEIPDMAKRKLAVANSVLFSLVQFSHSVVSDSLSPYGL